MQQRGFTLVELLAAMLMGSIVAVTLGFVARTMSNEARNQQMISEASQGARSGIDQIRLDLMRVGMFVAANPRTDQNTNSLTSDGQAGFLRNPIVHLNPGAGGNDAVILVGSFIGDRAYEGQVDPETDELFIDTEIPEDLCRAQFNPAYAFAHIITATGQTHEVQIASVDYSGGQCQLTAAPGELIEGAFGERNVKIAANQSILYRVDTVDGRLVLMRYYMDYSSTFANCDDATAIDSEIDYNSATVVAENVTTFQIWFRSIDPLSVPDDVDFPLYHASGRVMPTEETVLFGATAADDDVSGTHIHCPTAADGTPNVMGPEHMRAAMVSLSVRSELPDQQIAAVSGSERLERELESAGTNEGFYRIRNYTVEIKLPNIMSQMADMQFPGDEVPTL